MNKEKLIRQGKEIIKLEKQITDLTETIKLQQKMLEEKQITDLIEEIKIYKEFIDDLKKLIDRYFY